MIKKLFRRNKLKPLLGPTSFWFISTNEYLAQVKIRDIEFKTTIRSDLDNPSPELKRNIFNFFLMMRYAEKIPRFIVPTLMHAHEIPGKIPTNLDDTIRTVTDRIKNKLINTIF